MLEWSKNFEPETLGNVAVLYGGWSNERSVSLESGTCVLNACKRLGVNVVGFDLACPSDLFKIPAEDIDLCLLALHGGDGENGRVQSVLDLLGIPYVGSGVRASAVCMNKVAARLICKAVGVPVVPWQEFAHDQAPYQPEFNFPICLKPVDGGSSIGVSKIKDLDHWLSVRKSLADGQWMLEPWFSGVDHFVGILGNAVLPPLELSLPSGQFFDYDNKYSCSKSVKYEVVENKNIEKWMLAAYSSLGCRHYARADFITIGARSWFLEMNTLPGLSPICLLPRQSKAAGLGYDDFVKVLLQSYAMEIECA